MTNYLETSNSKPDLEEVSERALKGWIPVQASVVEGIGQKIKSGAYGNSAQMLINDLKQDVSSYLYVIRAFLDKSVIQEDRTNSNANAPFSILVPLLEGIQKTYGDDRLKNGSEFQLELLKECILASTTVEALSASFSLDKGFAYSVSSLRSLGKLLLAFNYPNEFNSAVEILNQSPGNTSLETVLTNSFGFSPGQVGAKVAQKMGLSSGVYNLLQNPTIVVQTSSSATSVHNRLNCVCGFGEEFAKAHSTLSHDVSEKSLKDIVKIIEDSIGSAGIGKIYKKSNATLSSYKSCNPKFFTSLDEDLGNGHVDPSQFSLKTELNRLARKGEVRNFNLLSEIISDFGNPTNRPLSIKKLVSELLPKEGVDAIILYTIDPVEKDLIAICKKGNPLFVKIKEASPIFGVVTNSLVKDVFDGKRSHEIEGLNANNEEVVACLAPYPAKKPYGVLYIEAKKKVINKQRLMALCDLAITLLSKLYLR